MKNTAKNYQELYNQQKNLAYATQKAIDNDNPSQEIELKNQRKKIQAILETFPKANVSFNIGSRSYYREVVKIGKSYFQYGERMTKGRGYWFINEIDEINEKMKEEMLADSYYY